MAELVRVQVFAEQIDKHEREHLSEAISTANGLQTLFRMRDQIKGIRLPGVRTLNGDKCLDYVADRLPANGDRIICITSREFSDNSFSEEDRRVNIASISDWEAEYAPPSLEAYLVYQMASAFASFAADLTGAQKGDLMHEDETRGCLMDYCDEKDDIKYGMLAGYMCGACTGELLRSGATRKQLDAVGRLLRYVQSVATGRQARVDWNTVFVVMRFSEGDENQLAFEHGIKPGLEDVGLRVRRGDDRVEPRQILEKVNDAISRCQFIVAKVDVNNLNVYYELGLAMGADKDVLLISEQNLSLPTDLTNWECLTYTKGDYGSLRKAVAKFFRDNYHYEPVQIHVR